MDLIGAMGNVEFSDADRERILSLSPIVKENSGKIVDELFAILVKDEEILAIMRENSLSLEDSKELWQDLLESLFSEPLTGKTIEKLSTIGVVQANRKEGEKLIMAEMGLLMLNTLGVLSNSMEVNKELYDTIFRLFAIALSVMVSGYSDEKVKRRIALVKSLGISEALLERLTKLGRK